MEILGISGSLRALSINSALLRAAARLAPPGVRLRIFQQLAELPLFNPDLESNLPDQVMSFYRQVAAADALLICSPEYAHGISGALKNALDWLVSFEPFVDKPVAVINTSARAHHADTALREVLKTMSARIVEPASVTVPLLSAGLADDAIVADPVRSAAIIEALDIVRRTVGDGPAGAAPLFPVA